MNESERDRIIELARDAVLSAAPNAWAAYVHGNFAGDDEGPDRDLDLAVLLSPGTSMSTVGRACGRSDTIGRYFHSTLADRVS